MVQLLVPETRGAEGIDTHGFTCFPCLILRCPAARFAFGRLQRSCAASRRMISKRIAAASSLLMIGTATIIPGPALVNPILFLIAASCDHQRSARRGKLFVIIAKIHSGELSKMLTPTGIDLTERHFFIHSNPACLYGKQNFANCTKNQQIGIFVVFILHILCPCVKMRTIDK